MVVVVVAVVDVVVIKFRLFPNSTLSAQQTW